MMTIIVDVLEAKTQINGNSYPLYTGFLSAEKLIQIAEVPSFPLNKPHHKIASDVINPPIDEWQRPEDKNKLQVIKEIYGDVTKDNLMANPVLLGTAIQNINPPNISIQVSQKSIIAADGNIYPIPKLYEIKINYENNSNRPLWILDGQHRIKGLSNSSQKGELIPFVLLHDNSKYTPPFLAEIFTHVTTGAKPMEPIHGEWMKYAFKLEQYKKTSEKSAMECVIYLCKETSLGGQANPFCNQIKFNPYLQPSPKWNAFEFDSIEWQKIIASNYYGKGGKFSPKELAEEIVKSTLAMQSHDSRKGIDSKLFSANKPHKILAEAYLIGLLTYLANRSRPMTYEDWLSFYLDPRRAVNRCNFSLPFVKSTGALSSNNGKPSKKIATNCFIDFFENPNDLNGQILTDFLQGIGGVISVISYETRNGRTYKNTSYKKELPFGSGLTPYDLSNGGISRQIIFIKNSTSNIYITDVRDGHYKPAKSLKSALNQSGQNVSEFNDNYEIEVEYMSYGGDTKKVTEIRFDK